jgi:hypothetical protein
MRRALCLSFGGAALVVLGACASACRSVIFSMIEPKRPPLENLEVPEGLSELSSTQCGACHREIYEEWKGSMHAKAWVDPVFQKDYEHQGRVWACTYCHTPVGQQREVIVTGLASLEPLKAKGKPNERFDPKLQAEGVTCVACHLKEGKIRSPFALEEGEAPHAIEVSETLGTPATCRTCHEIGEPLGSELKRPILDTFAEWDEYRAKGGDKTCLDCHMPAVTRPTVDGGPERPGRRHVFRGPHDFEFVKTAVEVRAAEARRVGDKLIGRLVLANATGHRLPTAEPMRRVEVVLQALGPEGEVLGEAISRVERVVDIPGYKEHSDNTLLPREARPFSLSLPAKGAASARLLVRYYLWEPTHFAVEGTPAEELIVTLAERAFPL